MNNKLYHLITCGKPVCGVYNNLFIVEDSTTYFYPIYKVIFNKWIYTLSESKGTYIDKIFNNPIILYSDTSIDKLEEIAVLEIL